ncbi:hypothetical protein HPB48_015090 [Haemaphysalis longicornis]|uniref:Sulfotransferase domain-containing protein n=1 Tax=Haemaphysalis longicornis TaxID=44386 RepID=A0A9J6GS49_HAELO|nr:hypothetical protein HPB48_015090 [Haemaphysalis longicornis]
MQVCKPELTYQDVYRDFEGLYISHFYTDRKLRSAFSYTPTDEDIFIASFPKCGTTWMQHIVCNIFCDGSPPATVSEIMKMTPFLEAVGAETVRAMSRPGAIKTHLPFNKLSYSAKAKYIYITRNPYDCCVSYYYHTKSYPMYCFTNGTFDQFFDMFIEGKAGFGDYFDHLMSWYAHRNDHNVFFLTYEQLKKDTAGMVLKIADFLGEEQYGCKLKRHPEILGKILDGVNVSCMRKSNPEFKIIAKEIVCKSAESTTEYVKSARDVVNEMGNVAAQGNRVRKGVVGDWRNHFSRQQVDRMKEKIALKTAGTEVLKLWAEWDLP